MQAGDGSKRPVHFYREEMTLSGLISFHIPEDSPHTALQQCLCLELGVPRSSMALGGAFYGGGTQDPKHPLSCCVVRDGPPGCGSCVVCLWEEGGKFLPASPLHLLRPHCSSVSISSVARHQLGAGVITCYRSKEAGQSRVTAGTDSAWLLKALTATW